LLGVAVLMLGLLIQQRKDLFAKGWLGVTAFCLLIGGIVGNAIDRVARGTVVDFIHVHWEGVFDFPAFNVADSAICIGAALYLISSFIGSHSTPQKESC
ncbi:MAG: signal peptidase II, partial [Kiritimatiellaeota bacterium]|nr:signal peptidase II [Kiritimatiellota bacterium]